MSGGDVVFTIHEACLAYLGKDTHLLLQVLLMLLKVRAPLEFDPDCPELLLTFDLLCVELTCERQHLVYQASILRSQLLCFRYCCLVFTC